ncbi:MAG: DUF3343 domain-containing protein [Clostridia bacterium]|nr:DUF3343 domain-containing protein [Clostridia bacterium]
MTVVAVFRSRAQALGYLSALKNIGVVASAVNTPKEANVGCGISVKLDVRFLPRAENVLKSGRYSSFSGWMKRIGYSYVYL